MQLLIVMQPVGSAVVTDFVEIVDSGLQVAHILFSGTKIGPQGTTQKTHVVQNDAAILEKTDPPLSRPFLQTCHQTSMVLLVKFMISSNIDHRTLQTSQPFESLDPQSDIPRSDDDISIHVR